MGIQKSHLEIKGPVSHFPEGPAHGFVDQVMLVMQQRFGDPQSVVKSFLLEERKRGNDGDATLPEQIRQ